MSGQGRLGDKAQVQQDAHGCPGCPHPGVGPAIAGSANVFVNGRPALRVDDVGIHAACCGPNLWQAQQGAATVFINGKAAFRISDPTRHCGGQGKLMEGSDDVIVGGAGGSGSAGAASASSGATPSGAPGKEGTGATASAEARQAADEPESVVEAAGAPGADVDAAPGPEVDAALQAAVLRRAAEQGVPFCAECERRRQAGARPRAEPS